MYADQIDRALKVREHRNNVREFHHCVKEIFELHSSQQALKDLQARPDLDTICAWDYQRMKKHALAGGLSYADYNPAARGITVPKME